MRQLLRPDRRLRPREAASARPRQPAARPHPCPAGPVHHRHLPLPALTDDNSCSAYTDRPTICRLWGAIDALRCPHGCRSQPAPLDDSTALQLLVASLHAGGDTGTLGAGPLPTPHGIACALQNALAAIIRDMLRSQTTSSPNGDSD